MPQLQWDKTDFLRCLEVEPQVEEYETGYFYRVEKDGMILEMSVYQYESVMGIWLSQSGQSPMIELWLFINGEVRYINDKRGEYLECKSCVLVPDRFFWYQYVHDISYGNFLKNVNFQMRIKPQISLKFE